jgi:hypothetical protein
MKKGCSIPDSAGAKRSREEESQSSSDEGEMNPKRSRIDRSSSENEASNDEDFEEDLVEEDSEIAEFEEEEDFVEDIDDYQDSEEGEIYDSDNDKSENKRKGPKTSAHRQTRKLNTASNENTRQKQHPRQKLKLKSAARVGRSSSRSDNEEGTDVDEDLDIPDQKSNFQPSIVYNEHWSKTQEKRLRRDQFIFSDISALDELYLPRRASASALVVEMGADEVAFCCVGFALV